jgi:predicted acylesterase/phospholipase RssA/CRP-like cAMP-binding protein
MTQPSDDRLEEIAGRYFGLSGSDARDLIGALQHRNLRGGEWLMRQGEPADALCFLVRGRLQVWIESQEPDATQPGRRLLGEVAPGESVGELGLLTGSPRSASVRAIRDSVVLELHRDAFERFAVSHPTLVVELAGGIAKRLESASARTPPMTRKLGTIAIVPLDEGPAVGDFCDRLVTGLSARGPTTLVRGEPAGGADHWMDELERRHRHVVYRADSAATAWSKLCMRQADIILLLADATRTAAQRPWERELLHGTSAPVARQVLVLCHPPPTSEIRGTHDWLAGREPDFHLHVRADRPNDMTRIVRILAGEAVGLVLGAGAARGFAELGVYRALVEAGIPIDWVGGTSIGSIMAAVIALDRGPQDAIQRVREAFVGGKPFNDLTVPVMSLLRGRRMQRLLKAQLDMRIEDLPTPYFCVSSMLDGTRTNVHERGSLLDAIRASAALPGMLPPMVIDGRLAIDGSVINSLPVDVMKEKLVGKIIAVDLSSRRDYLVEYDELPSPWAVLRGRLLPFAKRHRVPGLASTMLKATEIGTMARTKELCKQADLLLQPPVGGFSMTEVRGFDRIVAAGYDHTQERLAETGFE